MPVLLVSFQMSCGGVEGGLTLTVSTAILIED